MSSLCFYYICISHYYLKKQKQINNIIVKRRRNERRKEKVVFLPNFCLLFISPNLPSFIYRFSLSVCLFVCPSVCQSVLLSVCLFLSLSLCWKEGEGYTTGMILRPPPFLNKLYISYPPPNIQTDKKNSRDGDVRTDFHIYVFMSCQTGPLPSLVGSYETETRIFL